MADSTPPLHPPAQTLAHLAYINPNDLSLLRSRKIQKEELDRSLLSAPLPSGLGSSSLKKKNRPPSPKIFTHDPPSPKPFSFPHRRNHTPPLSSPWPAHHSLVTVEPDSSLTRSNRQCRWCIHRRSSHGHHEEGGGLPRSFQDVAVVGRRHQGGNTGGTKEAQKALGSVRSQPRGHPVRAREDGRRTPDREYIIGNASFSDNVLAL